MSFDFALETKLKSEAPQLHKIFADNVMCCQNILIKYKSVFPNYTDHTALHSLEVIAFCNELIGDELDRLNCDEIFILLMAAYLHDSGMGLSDSDFREFSATMPEVTAFIAANPDTAIDEVIRNYHNDFSGKFIEKYALLFDFPSKEHLFSVIQVSRGHRKTDLFDEKEYPRDLKLPNGNTVHLPYLATLIRLADELDIAVDRNIQFLYSASKLSNPLSAVEFKKHQAIKKLEFGENCLIAYVDYSDRSITKELDILFSKLRDTLAYCVRAAKECTPFTVRHAELKIVKLNEKT